MRSRIRLVSLLVIAAIIGVLGVGTAPASAGPAVDVVIQGTSARTTVLVEQVGGTILQRYAHVGLLTARVPAAGLSLLERAGLRFTVDQQVVASSIGAQDVASAAAAIAQPTQGSDRAENGPPKPPALTYPSLTVDAARLHSQGIDGSGVTVAVIDSGMPNIDKSWSRIDSTTLGYSNNSSFIVYKDLVAATVNAAADPYGHGTHVIGTIADRRALPPGTVAGGKNGIAPAVNLVVVRALDAQGQAPYSRVIAAIDWLIANKTVLNIKVLNLSLQAPIHGPYWDDPLGQAAMAAWQAGITVVVAAGNGGPAPATITVPANVPYVITVGALRPAVYTQSGVDELAPYSSAGPTESKFAKPDVVVAGSRVIAPLARGSSLESSAGLAKERVRLEMQAVPSKDELNYYYLSGTSMAAAEVTGMVALLLDDEPNLTNNQIKYRLTSTAKAASATDGQAMYSIWQQGAGRVNAYDVVKGTSTTSANAGMDIVLDRDHENGTHYMGPAAYDEASTTFYMAGQPIQSGSYQSWAGSYQSWAGSYQSWAGSYQSWAGSYQSWAGSYQSWAGSYQSWAGSYQSWAGSYQSWAGSYQSWAGSYQSWAGSLVNDSGQ